MIDNKFMLAFSILNAVFSLAAATLAFLGAKVGKNKLKLPLGWIYSASFVFWMWVIFPVGANFLLALAFAAWLVWAIGVIKDLSNIRS